MLENYIENFNNNMFFILFIIFKYSLLLLCISLIFSLIMLILGCIIKSKKIKLKFIKVAPILLLGVIFMLIFPLILQHFMGK